MFLCNRDRLGSEFADINIKEASAYRVAFFVATSVFVMVVGSTTYAQTNKYVYRRLNTSNFSSLKAAPKLATPSANQNRFQSSLPMPNNSFERFLQRDLMRNNAGRVWTIYGNRQLPAYTQPQYPQGSGQRGYLQPRYPLGSPARGYIQPKYPAR